MEMPIATDNGKPIVGLVRGNFIPDTRAETASLADRNHKAYPVLDPESPDHLMTVRNQRLDPPQVVPRSRRRFVDGSTVTVDGGFESGRIYGWQGRSAPTFRSLAPVPSGRKLATRAYPSRSGI